MRYKVVVEIKVFLYCRVAHNDGFSLEAQERELRFHAAQSGYTIIGAATEHGSGLTLDRPALQKVTQAVQSDKVELVLVMSIDRIGREWGTTQRYIDLLTEHRAKLLCIKERCLFSDKGVTYF